MIPIHPTDDDWVLIFGDALSAVSVAEPGAEVSFDHLYRLARKHTQVNYTPATPKGVFRRLLARTGFRVDGRHGSQVVKGLRLIEAEEAAA
ncbi:hypothetical protein [Streptomyces sp. NPDC057636]|uniref:hypothetical protein n=1 Tax=Streptomyces sp. NPDC057636 TaxID=3346189 RepID=UPI0036BA02CC